MKDFIDEVIFRNKKEVCIITNTKIESLRAEGKNHSQTIFKSHDMKSRPDFFYLLHGSIFTIFLFLFHLLFMSFFRRPVFCVPKSCPWFGTFYIGLIILINMKTYILDFLRSLVSIIFKPLVVFVLFFK